MQLRSIYITGLCTLFLMMSCSIQKHLPPGTQLYKGATYTVVKGKDNKTSTRSIVKQLKSISVPAANKTILGFPYRVWFWYRVGEPERTTGLRYWLRYRIGQEPILSTAVNVKANAANLQNYLENKGYFTSKVSGDTVVKGYKVTARYKVGLGMPYHINTSAWLIDRRQHDVEFYNNRHGADFNAGLNKNAHFLPPNAGPAQLPQPSATPRPQKTAQTLDRC